MARKGGSPPEERTEEEDWKPPGTDKPLQRTFDMALDVGPEDDDEEEPDFIYGDIVHDTEVEEPIALVVVNVPCLVAEEWEFEEGDTLADRNDKYPDDDDVIIAVHLGVLEEYKLEWDTRKSDIPIDELVEEDIPFAPFPSLQLVRVKDSYLRE